MVRRFVAAATLVALTGCGGFFPPLTTPTNPTDPTNPGGTGNYVYVANQTNLSISGFAVGTSSAGIGTLTAIAGSPYGQTNQPTAMVVTPSNSFLYVSSGVSIYAYSIGTGGALTLANSSNAVALTDVGAVSMDVSPDGKWLFALSGNGATLYEFAINASTGVLTAQATPTYAPASGTVTPRQVKVAPNGAYVFVALGTGGDLVFPFTTSTGLLGSYRTVPPVSATTGDNALAVDNSSSYLFVARSGGSSGLAVFAIGSGGSLTAVAGSPFATGAGPFSILPDSTGKYLYTANRTDGTISGFSIGSGGVLTALSGSPYTSGTAVRSLERDSSGKYVLAAAQGGSPDLTLYSFDATAAGKLNSTATSASGTDPAGSAIVVATH